MASAKSTEQSRRFDELKNWPYDWEATDRTLDPGLLDAHGTFLLNRALNTRSVVAFVGSGVSSVYGRVSWRDLTVQHMESLQRFLKKESAGKPAEIDDLEPTLLNLLSQAREGTNTALMLGLQVCEQIWSAIPPRSEYLTRLATHFGLRTLMDNFKTAPLRQPELGHNLFRHWMKAETYDELAHVRRVIHGGLWSHLTNLAHKSAGVEHDADRHATTHPDERQTIDEWATRTAADRSDTRKYEWPSSKEKEKLGWLFELRELRRFRESPRQYLPLFSRAGLEMLDKAIPIAGPDPHGTTKLAADIIRSAMATGLRDADTGREQGPSLLQPSHYFAVGFSLDLLRYSRYLAAIRETHGDHARAADRASGDTFLRALFDALKSLLEPDQQDALPRSKIIDPRRDPLYQLFYDLHINRFVTTNYDLEIERLMDDIGFTRPQHQSIDRLPDPDIERVGPLGGRARDIDLTPKTAVDLIDFAANESPHEMTVVHLHGRSTRNSDLVVTERDYQTRYLRDDQPGQLMIREGLDVLFGGNPILFVGLGLSEDDLMRPLRQFVSDQFKRNRTLVAFVSPTEDEEKRNAEAMELYARYGVSVIYFGHLTDGDLRASDGKDDFWLQWLHQDSKSLVTLLTAMAGWKIPSASERSQTREQLARLFTKRDGDPPAAGAQSPTELEARRRAFFAKARAGDFGSDGRPCDIRLPIDLLISVRDFAMDWPDHRLGETASDPGTPSLSGALFKDVLIPAVERARSAVLSAALSAKLAGAAEQWQLWWRDWQRLPGDRTELVSYFDRKLAGLDGVGTWCRYHVDDALAQSPCVLNDKEHGFGFFLRSITEEPPRGRRTFVLMSKRGGGKGHFFSTLTRHADQILKQTGCQPYSKRFCATFSYSCEIASVWDALIMFLAEGLQDSEQSGGAAGAERAPFKALQAWAKERKLDIGKMGRLDRLRAVLNELKAKNRRAADRAATNESPRFLVAFNTIDILVQRDGYPKNAEIRGVFDIILSDEMAWVPIDFVFIVRDNHLPLYFKAGRDADDAVKRLRQEACKPVNFDVIFPPWKDEYAAWEKEYNSCRQETNVTLIRHQVRLNNPAWFQSPRVNTPRTETTTFQPNAWDGAVDRFFVHVVQPADPARNRRDFDVRPNSGTWENLDEFLKKNEKEDKPTDHDIRPNSQSSENLDDALKENEQENNPTDHEQRLDELFGWVGRNRFLFTVVMRALDAFRSRSDAEPEAADKARRRSQARSFLQEVKHTATASEGGREDRLLRLVLDRYANQLWDQRNKAEDPRLCEALIRHLAIISTTIEVDVLASCPNVRQIARQILFGQDNEADVADGPGVDMCINYIVGCALKVLIERGLVFGLRNRPNTGDARPRFALHRFVQLYVYRRLSAQAAEPTEANLFTISLYASQAIELPTLSASAYRFVDELLDHLILYPRRAPDVNRSPDLHARCLRAALAVTRTLLPLGVVSRFADLPGLGPPPSPECGHVEHRRLAVRWLLRASVELKTRREESEIDAIREGIEDRLRNGLNAFYEPANELQQKRFAKAGDKFWRCLATQINSLRQDLKLALANPTTGGSPDVVGSTDQSEERKAKQNKRLAKILVANHAKSGAQHALPKDFAEFPIEPDEYSKIVKEVSGILEDYIRNAETEPNGAPGGASDDGAEESATKEATKDEIGKSRLKIERIVEKWTSAPDAIDPPVEILCAICDEELKEKSSDSGGETPPQEPAPRTYAPEQLAMMKPTKQAKDPNDWPPFYRDEVMWLYNECGVFSLAQGNMHDAHALLERALEQANRIEGTLGGAMRHRLLLNRGLAALHRGRIAEARRDFEEALHADEDVAIHHIAMGYLGSCLHLDAQLEAAKSHYERALDGLIALPRLRAASIVARNLADLYWHQERPDAKDMYETSVRLAFAAGSVDLVHLHRTGQTRVLRQDTTNTAHLREARRFLEEAEKYANQMDLPYLLADVLNAHADIQLAHKDAKAAAIYATRALRIARLSGLRLRKLAFLEGITRIYRERGENEAAERLLERVLQSARDIGYRILAERAFREKRILIS